MKRVISFLIVLLLLGGASYAQTAEESPKIGLVLSGGGAKGLAHIGVLMALDEANVKVDYIGGTSMGAIIGALYASGYSGAQIDSIFRTVDFEQLIQGRIPRSAMSYYERNSNERYALTLPFRNFKVGFPAALSNGQNVYNLLSRLLFHVNHIRDYNELPIPFFCMATDVETGEAVKLDHGYLPLSISASGAFPSLFEPFEIDGRVLIDGGVVNNYPIHEVRAMGADIIIGVDVQDALASREELLSATGILLQINNYRTVNDMAKKKSFTDLYIKPDISEFTVISFDQGATIVENGYLAARGKIELLDSLASLNPGKKKVLERIHPTDTFRINQVKIQGNENYSRRYIKGKLRYDTNELTDFEELGQGINNLLATGNFTTARYVLRPSEQGYAMEVNLKESNDELLLRLGVHYDDLYQTAGLINLTKKKLFLKDDTFSFDFMIGDEVRYQLDYYVDQGSYWSFGVRSKLNSFDRGVDFDFVSTAVPDSIPGVNQFDISLRDITNQLYMQTQWREEFTFGVGLEHKSLRIETPTITDVRNQNLIFGDNNFVSTYGYLKLDTLDDRYFPTSGIFLDADFHLYLLSAEESPDDFSEFSIAKAKLGFAIPVLPTVSFNFFTEGGFHLGRREERTLDFVLGGYGNEPLNNIVPFLGYDFISFGGNSFVKAAFATDWEFARKHHLNFKANYANAGDDIFDQARWFDWPDFSGYAIGYGFESFIGPVEVKYTWSPETSTNIVLFNVGYWF